MNYSASHLEQSLATQITWTGLPEPVVEHRFLPPRRWRFDLAWPDHLVAVEVEGGTFVAGRHCRGKGFENDCEKLSEAAIAGWLVLRVTGAMVDDGRALALVERALDVREAAAKLSAGSPAPLCDLDCDACREAAELA